MRRADELFTGVIVAMSLFSASASGYMLYDKYQRAQNAKIAYVAAYASYNNCHDIEDQEGHWHIALCYWRSVRDGDGVRLRKYVRRIIRE